MHAFLARLGLNNGRCNRRNLSLLHVLRTRAYVSPETYPGCCHFKTSEYAVHDVLLHRSNSSLCGKKRGMSGTLARIRSSQTTRCCRFGACRTFQNSAQSSSFMAVNASTEATTTTNWVNEVQSWHCDSGGTPRSASGIGITACCCCGGR